MMNFNSQIIKHLKESGAIRRKCWGKYCFIYVEYDPFSNTDCFVNQNQNLYKLSAEAVLADDWEIVKDRRKCHI